MSVSNKSLTNYTPFSFSLGLSRFRGKSYTHLLPEVVDRCQFDSRNLLPPRVHVHVDSVSNSEDNNENQTKDKIYHFIQHHQIQWNPRCTPPILREAAPLYYQLAFVDMSPTLSDNNLHHNLSDVGGLGDSELCRPSWNRLKPLPKISRRKINTATFAWGHRWRRKLQALIRKHGLHPCNLGL